MTWETWSLFVLTEVVLVITPGPAVLLVLSQALSRGAYKSFFSACGILAAEAFYFALSATSLGAILMTSYNLFFAVKWMGAAYLIYLGLRSFLSKTSKLALPETRGSLASNWRIFINAVVVQAANPKALLFFTAILPQFINPRRAVAPQIVILGASSIVVELFILVGYGILAGKASQFARQPRFVAITNRIAGAVLIGAGAGLAALRRH